MEISTCATVLKSSYSTIWQSLLAEDGSISIVDAYFAVRMALAVDGTGTENSVTNSLIYGATYKKDDNGKTSYMENVQITVYVADGNLVAEDKTDAIGTYTFLLDAGDYIIYFSDDDSGRYNAGYDSDDFKIHYAFTDLDGDGISEMLMSFFDEEVHGIYWYNDGEIRMLYSGEIANGKITIYTDGTIYIVNQDGIPIISETYFQLKNSEMETFAYCTYSIDLDYKYDEYTYDLGDGKTYDSVDDMLEAFEVLREDKEKLSVEWNELECQFPEKIKTVNADDIRIILEDYYNGTDRYVTGDSYDVASYYGNNPYITEFTKETDEEYIYALYRYVGSASSAYNLTSGLIVSKETFEVVDDRGYTWNIIDYIGYDISAE